MRRARFRDPAGDLRTGQWTDDGIRTTDRTYHPDAVQVLPPCRPTKVVCIGANYRDHVEEMDGEVPDRPKLFLKPPSAVVGHHATVELLPGVKRHDQEAELGVVVGERCRRVAEADALDVVAGYTCVNDLSNRDDQRIEQNWVRGKAFDGACPMGPCLADPEEVPGDARIVSRVDGQVRQDARIDEMIFGVPELIAEISRYMTLMPGDVISTGTPEGVGPVEPGQTIEIEIDGIGTLEHDVSAPAGER